MDNNLKNKIQVLINKYKVGDFKSVLDSCSVLIKKHPKNDFLWNLTGLSFQNIGNQMKAITSFQNAIENNSKNISAINNLGISYKISRQYSKAEEIFTKLLLATLAADNFLKVSTLLLAVSSFKF